MVSHIVIRNAGHPWDRRKRKLWDGMEVIADSKEELNDFIAAARKKFWSEWIVGCIVIGDIEKPTAYLYKPSGATGPWTDNYCLYHEAA